ncbi:NADP-dependent oxidoreductase domain-containing protein [Rhexocercosporidium sp. MPI-PUGE-AT-0058]|nr:NADP-dependent oxidoreductase domain-containing protein [Rhexocercosporidium sp. MPI-PUGE-AT-0058]
MAQAPAIVFGTAGVRAFSTEQLTEVFDILDKHNVKQLDTARIYGPSEGILGSAGAPKRFIVSTKANGFAPGSMGKQGVLESIETSLKELQAEQVDIFYLHSPDPNTPIEETLAAIQEIYAAGKFKRFGLSNFRPADVQKIYDIQAAAKSVLPSVFQGNYSAVARHIEGDLFPLLRKLKIAFYAYSPIAGGFLVKDAKSLRAQEVGGRWGKESPIGDMYVKMYTKDSMLDVLDHWEVIAKDAGISKASLAYRWIAFHSALKAADGDAIIIGASRPSQVEETCSYIEQGPLDAKIAERVSELWKSIEKDAPVDNWNSHAGLKV